MLEDLCFAEDLECLLKAAFGCSFSGSTPLSLLTFTAACLLERSWPADSVSSADLVTTTAQTDQLLYSIAYCRALCTADFGDNQNRQSQTRATSRDPGEGSVPKIQRGWAVLLSVAR